MADTSILQNLSKIDFGLKKTTTKFLKSKYGYNKNRKIEFIGKEEFEAISNAFNPEVSKLPNEQVKILEKINFYKVLQNNRGIRHQKYLPVRGQSTRTNSKTNRKKHGARTRLKVKRNRKKLTAADIKKKYQHKEPRKKKLQPQGSKKDRMRKIK